MYYYKIQDDILLMKKDIKYQHMEIFLFTYVVSSRINIFKDIFEFKVAEKNSREIKISR